MRPEFGPGVLYWLLPVVLLVAFWLWMRYHRRPIAKLLVYIGEVARGRAGAPPLLHGDFQLLSRALYQMWISLREHRVQREDELHRQRVIGRIGVLLTSSLDWQKTLPRMLEEAEEFLPAKHAIFIRRGEMLSSVPRGEKAFRFAVGEGLAGFCAKHNQMVLANDAPADARFVPTTEDVRHILCLPLSLEGEVVGVYVLYNKVSGEPFFAGDAEVMAPLCTLVATYLRTASLYQQAIRDEKTGLYTMGFLLQKLAEERKRSQRYRTPLSLMILDLDHFKEVNDAYGHMVGDEVLKVFADKIREGVREIDVAARFGGEEFAVLLPETDEGGALVCAQRILRAMREHRFLQDGSEFTVTASAGVAQLTEDERGLLDRADRALYAAKRAGRDRVAAASQLALEA